jgi:hypothetical protein
MLLLNSRGLRLVILSLLAPECTLSRVMLDYPFLKSFAWY